MSCETCVNTNEFIHQCEKIFFFFLNKLEFTYFVLKWVTPKRLHTLRLQMKTFKKFPVILEMPIFRIEVTTVIAFVCFTSHVIKIQGVSKGGSESFRDCKAHDDKHFFV